MKYFKPKETFRRIRGRLNYCEADRACTRLRLRKSVVEEYPTLANRKDEPCYEIIYLYGKEQVEQYLKNEKSPVVMVLKLGTEKE